MLRPVPNGFFLGNTKTWAKSVISSYGSMQKLQTRDQNWELIMRRKVSYPDVILSKAGDTHYINYKIQQSKIVCGRA
jgi:hypothetical protein